MNKVEKKLIVLDLDETLIYASNTTLDHPSDYEIPPFFIYKRPNLDEFLDFCSQTFVVAVWTSATEDYAQSVIRVIFPPGYPLAFVYSRERCTCHYDHQSGNTFWIKDLKKVKRNAWAMNSETSS